jgi:hypothetical protein
MTKDCDPTSIKALKTRMKAYHEDLAEQAEKAVFIVLPSKILELSQLIDLFSTAGSPFTVSHPCFKCDSTILSLPSTIPTEGYRPSYGRSSRSPSNSSAEGTDSVKSECDLEPLADVTPAFSSIDASHDAGALGGEHEDDKPIRTGLRTNPIFDVVGRVMDQQGTEVLRFCMQIRRWMATVTPQVEEGNNTGQYGSGHAVPRDWANHCLLCSSRRRDSRARDVISQLPAEYGVELYRLSVIGAPEPWRPGKTISAESWNRGSYAGAVRRG